MPFIKFSFYTTAARSSRLKGELDWSRFLIEPWCKSWPNASTWHILCIHLTYFAKLNLKNIQNYLQPISRSNIWGFSLDSKAFMVNTFHLSKGGLFFFARKIKVEFATLNFFRKGFFNKGKPLLKDGSLRGNLWYLGTLDKNLNNKKDNPNRFILLLT